MNIFYLHEDPKLAASYVYDKHKVKMILESAQMLCTAHHCYGSAEQRANVPYKQAHLNHPSSVWTRASIQHYNWLYDHMIALGNEYTKRYNKIHLTITKCKDILKIPPVHIQGDYFEQPPQCMPDEYKRQNAIHGYWQYYIGDKHKICNKNEIPYTIETIPEDVLDKYYSGADRYSELSSYNVPCLELTS